MECRAKRPSKLLPMGALTILVGSWSAAALGQAHPPSGPAEGTSAASTTPARSESTQETLAQIETHHQELARLLDPRQYGRAFGIGAQADFVAPAEGVSALVVSYDAVFMQVDASLGIGLGGDPVNDKAAASTYGLDVRVGMPVHHGVRADFSIFVGGGATLVDPTEGNWYALVNALGGGRIRFFQSPNVAVTGTLGVAGIFRDQHSLFVLGAKPLGSASIVYYFR